MWLIDPENRKAVKIAYLRIQVLNAGLATAKGCIGKCEVWNEKQTRVIVPRERMAWQPRTAKDAVDPIDILPTDHEFMIIAWAQAPWRGNFIIANRKAYSEPVQQLPPGSYTLRVEVLSENAGTVKRTFKLKKGRQWDQLNLTSIGSQATTGAQTLRVGNYVMTRSVAVDAMLFEKVVGRAYELLGYNIEFERRFDDYSPDIIAKKNDESLAIEVKFYQYAPVSSITLASRYGLHAAYAEPGMKFVFVSSTGFTKSAKSYAESVSPRIQLVKASELLEGFDSDQFGKDAASLVKMAKTLRPREPEDIIMLDQLCQEYHTATGKWNKGRALEKLVIHAFNSVPDFEVTSHNVRTNLEEIDLIVANELCDGFVEILGNPILVESKNWTKKTGTREIRVFASIMESKTVRTGIFIASGGYTSGYKRFIRNQRRNARKIIPLDGSDIDSICEGSSVRDLIRDRFYESYKW